MRKNFSLLLSLLSKIIKIEKQKKNLKYLYTGFKFGLGIGDGSTGLEANFKIAALAESATIEVF